MKSLRSKCVVLSVLYNSNFLFLSFFICLSFSYVCLFLSIYQTIYLSNPLSLSISLYISFFYLPILRAPFDNIHGITLHRNSLVKLGLELVSVSQRPDAPLLEHQIVKTCQEMAGEYQNLPRNGRWVSKLARKWQVSIKTCQEMAGEYQNLQGNGRWVLKLAK